MEGKKTIDLLTFIRSRSFLLSIFVITIVGVLLYYLLFNSSLTRSKKRAETKVKEAITTSTNTTKSPANQKWTYNSKSIKETNLIILYTNWKDERLDTLIKSLDQLDAKTEYTFILPGAKSNQIVNNRFRKEQFEINRMPVTILSTVWKQFTNNTIHLKYGQFDPTKLIEISLMIGEKSTKTFSDGHFNDLLTKISVSFDQHFMKKVAVQPFTEADTMSSEALSYKFNIVENSELIKTPSLGYAMGNWQNIFCAFVSAVVSRQTVFIVRTYNLAASLIDGLEKFGKLFEPITGAKSTTIKSPSKLFIYSYDEHVPNSRTIKFKDFEINIDGKSHLAKTSVAFYDGQSFKINESYVNAKKQTIIPKAPFTTFIQFST